MKKISFVLVALAIVALFSSVASAGLIIQAVNADGTSVAAPGTVHGEIWATVTGTDAVLTNEYLQTVTGGLQITGGGTFTPYEPSVNTLAPWTFGNANSVDTSADGKLIGHGGLSSVTSGGVSTGPLYFRTNTPSPGESGNGPYRLGTFTVNNAQAGDSIQFLLSAASLSMYSFRVDGVSKSGTATAFYGVGAPLTVVPEPATLVLLGMGALALVFVRRRK